ncbi:hypothetical protein MTsDn5_17550 [Alteromonas gracilis]|uniref:glycosyltransferase n=1 Tax=Alteromonas gracilis TaxID=1479524 RepID=UPI0036F1F69F
MQVDIAICTWNRANELRRILVELGKCKQPEDVSVVITIIDNNSCDDTFDVVKDAKIKFKVNYFLERNQGLSHARNTALQNTHGDWLIFTDDDVSVTTNWIENWATVLKTLPNNIAFAGGEVIPRFAVPPNQNLLASMPMISSGFCGVNLPHEKYITSEDDPYPMGANFALNKSLIGRNQFNTKLGVSAGKRILGEERVFMRNLVKNGMKGIWVENVGLEHIIPENRLSEDSLKKQLIGIGQTRVLKELEDKGTHTLPSWVYRSFIENFFYMKLLLLSGQKDSVKYWKAFSTTWECWGWLKENFNSKY